MDALPPLLANTPNAQAERSFAKHVLEYAVILSTILGDKETFRGNMTSLRPYYLLFDKYVTS